MLDPDEQQRLIALTQRGDMAAFRRLYDAYLRRVSGQVFRILGPSSDIDDVVQEVFVQVHRSIANFRAESAFSTWLYRLTWNVTVSHLRRRGAPTVDLPALKQFACPQSQWDRLEARDKLRSLYAALDDLPADQRDAFVCFELEGMSLQEIATQCDEPLNTVASRVRRARERLRALLEHASEHASEHTSDHAEAGSITRLPGARR